MAFGCSSVRTALKEFDVTESKILTREEFANKLLTAALPMVIEEDEKPRSGAVARLTITASQIFQGEFEAATVSNTGDLITILYHRYLWHMSRKARQGG